MCDLKGDWLLLSKFVMFTLRSCLWKQNIDCYISGIKQTILSKATNNYTRQSKQFRVKGLTQGPNSNIVEV